MSVMQFMFVRVGFVFFRVEFVFSVWSNMSVMQFMIFRVDLLCFRVAQHVRDAVHAVPCGFWCFFRTNLLTRTE